MGHSTQRKPLPVWWSVGRAYGDLLRNPGPLARAMVLPMFGSFAIILSIQDFDPGAMPTLADLLAAVFSLLPAAYFAVAWHRFLLLGGDLAQPAWAPAIRPWHWRFLIRAVVLCAIVLLVSLTVGSLAAAVLLQFGIDLTLGGQVALVSSASVGAVVFLVAGWLIAQLGFVLPAAAVNLRYGFRESWRATRRIGWRLFAILVLVSLPILLASGLIATLFAQAVPPGMNLFLFTLIDLAIRGTVSYLWLALVFTALSNAFRSHGAPPGRGLDLASVSVSPATQE